MRDVQKQSVLEFIDSLHLAHEEIRKALVKNNIVLAQKMLNECQQFAYNLGGIIEEQEGEGHITISFLEEYCEVLFRIYEELTKSSHNANGIYKRLRKSVLKVENSVKNDISIRKEIVFFPYKASMWDSFESVYFAAKEDPDCDVYCVPIPYYDMNPDHSFGKFHYEGEKYPVDIEVTDWQTYNFEDRRPDVIYIHNPYDDCNYVTSVHPRYYSANLKKYTKTLVYIPYFSTSGCMGAGQRLCPAYMNVDYIVIQYPNLRKYFDERIPESKFLALGTPKFDKVIKKCRNLPKMPYEWKEKADGKKVFFYNTSLDGMLADTESFLKKMRYVFSCFEGREDVCILWRPHPLLEATFDSMRPRYKLEYMLLKTEFLEKKIGIYDMTSDVTDAIALSDAYLGDAGTSLISLFGIAGKPIFILDNQIHCEPGEESWREKINVEFDHGMQDRFAVVQGNRLYVSDPFVYNYRYLCDLSEKIYARDYRMVCKVDNKLYAIPWNVQNILVIDEYGGREKIELKHTGELSSLFDWAIVYEKYLILLPLKYPAIVRYDTVTGEIKYLKNDIDIFVKKSDGMIKRGGAGNEGKTIYLPSPIDNKMYSFDAETMDYIVIELPIPSGCGYKMMRVFQGKVWLTSCEGERIEIVCWDSDTNEAKVYNRFPENFKCIDPVSGEECLKQPFVNGVFYGDFLFLAPYYGNMYIKLNIVTGEMEEWVPPFDDDRGKEHIYILPKSRFLNKTYDDRKKVKIFSHSNNKLYEINPELGECNEIKIQFDIDELRKHEKGFGQYSEELRYCCCENIFTSVKNFIDGDIAGNPFNKDKQIEAYGEITSNHDGACGIKVHEYFSKL